MILTETITQAFQYLDANGQEVPLDLRSRAYNVGALKASGDLAGINSKYHDEITASLVTYFEGGSVTGPRNKFRQSVTDAFYDAFYLGWADGGASLPLSDEATAWLTSRVNQEYSFIDALFVQIKDLRNEEEFDFFSFVTERADGYVRAVINAYNHALLMAKGNQMLTFDGDDGSFQHICQSIGGTCVKLKGQRHRASWWISHDLVPYRGNSNYDCGGWHCKHFLRDDNGNRVTL